MRGDGEIIEEVVSYERHVEINKVIYMISIDGHLSKNILKLVFCRLQPRVMVPHFENLLVWVNMIDHWLSRRFNQFFHMQAMQSKLIGSYTQQIVIVIDDNS